MAEAKDNFVDRKIEKATHPVAAKPGEVSDAELEKVVGGEVSDYSFDVEQVLNVGR